MASFSIPHRPRSMTVNEPVRFTFKAYYADAPDQFETITAVSSAVPDRSTGPIILAGDPQTLNTTAVSSHCANWQ